CGYDYLEWQFPVDASSLTRWRHRLGKERMEKILSLTVSVAVDSGTIKQKDLERVIVDTTVMPKNIEFPTDSKLLNKSRKRLIKLAEENGVILRQNYNLKSKKLLRRIGGYLHAKQMKRARKAQKHLKTIVGRVKRDCERRIEGNAFLQKIFATELSMANHLLTRKVSDKKKIYSLHEPKVDCISKGKAHKRYEFGSKVALSITHKKGKMIITGCNASEGNPFDGRTLQSSIVLSEKLTGVKVKRAFIDKGYKGHGVENKEIFISGQRQGITATIKKQIKRRQAIEPHIGHMKQKVKLGLCRLHGVMGDQINAVLSAAAYNLRQVLRHLRYIFVQIILLLFGGNGHSVSKSRA
ncbi:MAG: IS5 family transposase, partial [Verrucomicrobia bacterium]|nr:IS5 family transposase [Verrucomicrobiota bacterium]